MENTIEIYNSKKKQMGALALGVVFLLIGFLGQKLIGLSQMLAYYALFFGGAMALLGILVLLSQKKGAVLIFTKEGLTINSKTPTLLKWTDIENYTDFSINGSHTILFHLKDTEKFISQLSKKRKKTAKFLMKLHGAPIGIAPAMLDISREKLKEGIHKHLVKFGNS